MGHRSRRIVRAALSCAVVAGCLASPASAQNRTVSAAAFHDSVGVTTHPTYFDTPYGRWADVVARMRELGVAHMRSGVYASTNAGWNARHWGDLSALANAGIRLHLIVNRDCADARTMDPLPRRRALAAPARQRRLPGVGRRGRSRGRDELGAPAGRVGP